MIFTASDFKEVYFIEHTVENNIDKFIFWFREIEYLDGTTLSHRIDGICTGYALYAKATLRTVDEPQLLADYPGFRLHIRYPTPPPSQKVLLAIGNVGKADLNSDPFHEYPSEINIKLPSASTEFQDDSWIEFGIEVQDVITSDPASYITYLNSIVERFVVELKFTEF